MKLDSSNMVSIHPYFKARPGRMPQIKPLLAAMVAKASAEKDTLFYDFTINGDEIFCREAYLGAAGAAAHVKNVSPLIGEMVKLADVVRVEIHGPAAEVADLKPLLADLKPACFIREGA